jgi:electron transport complex protein RnfG
MAKKVSNSLLSMSLTLLIVSGIAAIGLAFVYNLTKVPIEEVKKAKTKTAIEKVLPIYERFERLAIIPYDGGTDSLIFYKAFNTTEELVGIAVETFSNKGFGGQIKIMVGFLPDLTIYNTAVLEHKETPGLGDKMDISKSKFSEQFKGKNLDTFNLGIQDKDIGGDVDAITAATISSRAFCDAVDRAYKTLNDIKE